MTSIVEFSRVPIHRYIHYPKCKWHNLNITQLKQKKNSIDIVEMSFLKHILYICPDRISVVTNGNLINK